MLKILIERIHRMKKRTRVVLIALAILAVLAGWWWLSRPQEMRLVDITKLDLPNNVGYRFTSGSDYLLATLPVIAVIRWDGTIRWKVSPPESVLPIHCRKDADTLFSSVSPNKRYCATVTAHETKQRVMMWDEGRYSGSVTLPLTVALIRPRSSVHNTMLGRPTVLDNGQVLCWIPDRPVGSLILLEKGTMRAHGKLPVPPGKTLVDIVSYHITQDGRALIAATNDDITYYRITRSNDHLRCTRNYSARNESYRLFITSDGLLVTNTGSVYDAHGRVSGPTDWKLLPRLWWAPTSRSCIIQELNLSQGLFPGSDTATRILDPRTGKAWIPKRQQPHRWIEATPDGQYMVVDERHGPFFGMAREWLAKKELLPVWMNEHAYATHLSVYQRPGRFCARLSVIGSSDASLRILNPRTKQSLDLSDIALSEDSHTLRCLCSEDNGSSGYSYYILTYRWH